MGPLPLSPLMGAARGADGAGGGRSQPRPGRWLCPWRPRRPFCGPHGPGWGPGLPSRARRGLPRGAPAPLPGRSRSNAASGPCSSAPGALPRVCVRPRGLWRDGIPACSPPTAGPGTSLRVSVCPSAPAAPGAEPRCAPPGWGLPGPCQALGAPCAVDLRAQPRLGLQPPGRTRVLGGRPRVRVSPARPAGAELSGADTGTDSRARAASPGPAWANNR